VFIGAVFGSIASLLDTVVDLRMRTHVPPLGQSTSATAPAHERTGLDLLLDLKLSCREVAALTGLSVTTVVVRRRALGLPIAERRKSLTPGARLEAERLLDNGTSVAEAAAKAGISVSQAYRLLAGSSELKTRRDAVLVDQRRTASRADWLTHVHDHPELSITGLRSKAQAVYAWLYRNDRDWLRSTGTQSSGPFPIRVSGRVDWAERDRSLAEAVAPLAGSALAQHDGGRLTVTALLRAIGKESSIRQNLHRLPELRRQLLLHAETRDEFRKRRHAAALEKLRMQGHAEPADWRIAREAGLRTDRR
jgi:hypothetical protein